MEDLLERSSLRQTEALHAGGERWSRASRRGDRMTDAYGPYIGWLEIRQAMKGELREDVILSKKCRSLRDRR